MAVVTLTLPFITKATVSPGQHHTCFFDNKLPRFGLRVSQNNVKSFIIKYRNKYGKYKWMTIGQFGIFTLEEARTKARELLQQVDNGGDPAQSANDDKHAMTIDQLAALYFERGVNHKKQSTIESDKSRVKNHISPLIGKIPIPALTTANVEDLMADIMHHKTAHNDSTCVKPRTRIIVKGGTGVASRTIQTLSAMLQFAVRRGLIAKNVCTNIKKPKSNVRDVFLTLSDMRALGALLNDERVVALYSNAVNAIKLLALTGCRRGEILSLKWEYIDFENQIFRFPDTKTGKQNRPFGIAALELLKKLYANKKSKWVFPSDRDSNMHLTNLLDIFKRFRGATFEGSDTPIFNKNNVTLHTLRHSFATIAHDELGFSELTIAGLLGHHTRQNVTERYTHLVDSSQIHAANQISQLIASTLEPIITTKNNKRIKTKVA